MMHLEQMLADAIEAREADRRAAEQAQMIAEEAAAEQRRENMRKEKLKKQKAAAARKQRLEEQRTRQKAQRVQSKEREQRHLVRRRERQRRLGQQALRQIQEWGSEQDVERPKKKRKKTRTPSRKKRSPFSNKQPHSPGRSLHRRSCRSAARKTVLRLLNNYAVMWVITNSTHGKKVAFPDIWIS